MNFQKLRNTSFSLFFNGLVSTNLYSCLSMETLYFLHSLYSLAKLKKWHTFKSYIKERFWFLKKSQLWQKQYVMICYASSGSVLQLLHILSSRFTAILVYVPFLLLPLCDVIYVVSNSKYNLEYKKTLFRSLQCFRLQRFLYGKNKKHFRTCTYIIYTLFLKFQRKISKVQH